MRPWTAGRHTARPRLVHAGRFFWFPRTLMDLRGLLAYYDQPELIHQINQELLEFNLRPDLEQMPRLLPTFMTIAEDMSYNKGPMISKKTFDEFLAPYYGSWRGSRRMKSALVDTDGDVTMLVPWLQAGVNGVLPLERSPAWMAAGCGSFTGPADGRPFQQAGDAPGRGRHPREFERSCR